MYVYCECCVLASRGVCDGPIPRPEECYRMWRAECLNVTEEVRRRPSPTGGSQAVRKKRSTLCSKVTNLLICVILRWSIAWVQSKLDRYEVENKIK